MGEESKGRENSNNALIPEEAPGTAEQLKQYYNSEEWKEIKEKVIRVAEKLKEAMTPVVERIREAAKEFHKICMIAYSTDPEIKKCYSIYKRTRKRKDKKKANDQDK